MREKTLVWDIAEYPLENLTNEELYYVISSLLCLGDPGFSPERLYISFDERKLDSVSDIRFLLTSKTLFDLISGHEEVTLFHLGRIDSKFNEIEIYSSHCAPQELDPETEDVDASFIRSSVIRKNKGHRFHPVSFLNGVHRILSKPEFPDRKGNDLFELRWNSPLPNRYRHLFEFGKIGPYATNFSGNYYLVVEPFENNFGTAEINSFKVFDNASDDADEYIQHKIEVQKTFIDSNTIQRYDNEEADSPSYSLPVHE